MTDQPDSVADHILTGLADMEYRWLYHHRSGCGGVWLMANKPVGGRTMCYNNLYKHIKWRDGNGRDIQGIKPNRCSLCGQPIRPGKDMQDATAFQPRML